MRTARDAAADGVRPRFSISARTKASSRQLRPGGIANGRQGVRFQRLERPELASLGEAECARLSGLDRGACHRQRDDESRSEHSRSLGRRARALAGDSKLSSPRRRSKHRVAASYRRHFCRHACCFVPPTFLSAWLRLRTADIHVGMLAASYRRHSCRHACGCRQECRRYNNNRGELPLPLASDPLCWAWPILHPETHHVLASWFPANAGRAARRGHAAGLVRPLPHLRETGDVRLARRLQGVGSAARSSTPPAPTPCSAVR